jgi:anti-anti-sigma regulatory factor
MHHPEWTGNGVQYRLLISGVGVRVPDGAPPRGVRPGVRLTEVVDMRRGSMQVSGHLTVHGADLLRGTVESLQRDGHSTVVLDLAGLRAADEAGVQVLRTVRQSKAADGANCSSGPHRQDSLPVSDAFASSIAQVAPSPDEGRASWP